MGNTMSPEIVKGRGPNLKKRHEVSVRLRSGREKSAVGSATVPFVYFVNRGEKINTQDISDSS